MFNKIFLLTRFNTKFTCKTGACALVAILANSASADQFIGHQNGREVVVNTSPIPVFLHRLVPPNYGRHVTVREYQATRRSVQPIVTTAPNGNVAREVKSKP
ncbi:MAG: hypothetical protein NTY15_12745 [Planctomycetota bacterium]|nr:hypothetical protein [Planctomycetota bacterium]